MKTLLLVPFLLLLAAVTQDSRPSAGNARKAVERAVLDYVDGLYEVKPELIERSVHKDLAKIGFYRSESKAPYRTYKLDYEGLVKLAATWNKDGSRVDDSTVKEIELLEVLDKTAAVKLTAAWGVDFMQLGNFDGKWKIIHVIWQSHPNRKKAH